ncbi:MAG: trigger factor [Oscillospiraceae bacterium]
MSLTEHSKKEDGKYELTVAIDPKAFADAIEKVYRRENKKINIQGFRKGKAPRSIIERMYGDSFFFEDALNELLPDEFEKAVEEADIQIIDRPEVDVTEMSREKGVVAKFVCLLRPELVVKKYKGLSAERNVYNVEQADIDRELGLLREKQSRMITVENRPAQNGDIAVIDFEGFVNGTAFEGGKGDNFNLTLGSGQFIDGFEEQIVGHNVGDEFEINVRFPEEYGSEQLAGKEAVFKIKLHELRIKEMPELDDEFAKDASEFDTLKELTDSIKGKLAKSNERRSDSELENSLLEEIIENLEGEVPHVMIEEQIVQMINDFAQRLRSQGMELENYFKMTNSTIDSMKEEMRDNAAKNVRSRLALEAIIRAENFVITDEDIEAELKKYADDYEMDIEKIREAIPRKELAENLKATRALDLVRSTARVTDKVVSKDKTEDKPKKKSTKKTADDKPDEGAAE